MPTTKSDKPKFYMDTCLFISILADEKRANNQEYAGLKDIEYMIDNNKADAVVSSLVRVECIFHDHQKAREQQQKFLAYFERGNVHEIGLYGPIAQKAHDIIVGLAKQGSQPGHMDAIHLATAVYAEVDVFYTYDGCRNNTKLIALSGNEVLDGLRIEIPKPQLTTLGFVD